MISSEWACPRCGLRWGQDPLEVSVGPWCSGFQAGAEHDPMPMLPLMEVAP